MHQNSEIFCDQDAKHLVYRNGRYTAEVDYGGGFRISSLAVRKKQLLDRNRGIPESSAALSYVFSFDQ